MKIRMLCYGSLRRHLGVPAILVMLLAWPRPWRVWAEEPGTLGIVVRQIFSERQFNHRGPLAVLQVTDDSPAAKAGIHCGDFIFAVNGVPVPGRELSEIMEKEIDGPVGGTVRLTIARFDGSQSEITLVRVPYPPHVNTASDPFVYVVPGVWDNDPRYKFPLPWAPTLSYHGYVDLYFSPNFGRTDSPEYHSYVFFMSLEGTHMMSAEQVEKTMATWFRGLAVERGGNFGFTPDLSKVSGSYEEDSAAARTPGGGEARAMRGTENIWDTHGKVITLNSEVLILNCAASNSTAFYFSASLEPRDGPMWKQLHAIGDTFRCAR